MKSFLFFCIIIIFSLPAAFPLFQTGFFPMHDDTQVARVFEMGKALRDGVFPVRIVMDLGYGFGYPLFNFYGPLAYYIGGFFTLLGMESLVATKLMIILAIILSGVTMFVAGRDLWGRWGGLIAALFYIYAPYHALDIYVRGDIAESWAYVFIPLAFYGMWKVAQTRDWKYVFIGTVGFSGIILSHNLTALMVLPFLLALLCLLFLTENKKQAKSVMLILPLLFGMLISAFYWLPALFEMKYTNILSQIGGGAHYADHFVCPIQLWESNWGFGGSVKGCVDGMSFRIGKLHILGVLFAGLAFFTFKKRAERERVIFLFLIFALSIALFFLLPYSSTLWSTIPFMPYFQYPWRFLIIVSFFSSLLIGSLAAVLPSEQVFKEKNIRWVIPLGLVGITSIGISLLYLKLFLPQKLYNRTDAYYTNQTMLRYQTSKLSDEYLPKNVQKPQSEEEVGKSYFQSSESKIEDEIEKTGFLKASVTSVKPVILLIRLAYFPAWSVSVDEKKTAYQVSSEGLRIHLPQGTHTVTVRFRQTSVELLANSLSIIGMIMLCTGIIYYKQRG